jgi:serine/threonine protein kinase
MDEAPAENGIRWRDGMVLDRKYALVRLLGQGGVGAVFEAQNTWTGRRVAIKVLHPNYSRTEAAARRFLREAQNATQIAHRNIVDVLDLGQDPNEGSLFIVQEFLEGIDLRRWLHWRRTARPGEALAILLPVMDALGAMHAKQVVHRDLEPENIFLARTAEREIVPKVIDFGLSKALRGKSADGTRAGTLLGTPEYMSPEQALGDASMDERTDVWSIAVVLYELLCGRPPIESGSATKIISKILTEPPPRIERFARDIDASLAAIVHTGLEPDRDGRFASMAAFASALRGYAERAGLVPFAPIEMPEGGASAEIALRATQPKPDGYSSEWVGASARAPTAIDPVTRSDTQADEAPPDAQEAARLAPTSEEAERRTTSISMFTGTPGDPASTLDLPAAPRREAASSTDAKGQPAKRRSLAADPHDAVVRRAEQSLEMNALDEAIDRALRGLADVQGNADAVGRLLIVKATAHNWRGSTSAAEQDATRALSVVERYSDRWFQAAGELAIACGRRGRREQLTHLVDDLVAAPAEQTPASVIAACKLVTQLLDADWPELAESLLSRTQVEPAVLRISAVRAWIQRVRAAMALYAGDPSAYLDLTRSAAESFADAADAREACLQRAHVGDALRMLGSYRPAERVLQHALAAAEPMGLWVAHLARQRLAVVKAALGVEDPAIEMLRIAADHFAAHGDTRMLAISWIHSAQIHALQLRLGDADDLARAAIELLGSVPALRAVALGVTSRIALQQRRYDDALEHARAAMELINYLRRNDEGEAFVHLVHAEALYAMRDEDRACLAIMKARRRLRERAKRIQDEALRASYLEVPEHARTLQLAVKWLGD